MPYYPPPGAAGGGIQLQAVTPGVTETGHGHISGTFMSGQEIIGTGLSSKAISGLNIGTFPLDAGTFRGLLITQDGSSGEIWIGRQGSTSQFGALYRNSTYYGQAGADIRVENCWDNESDSGAAYVIDNFKGDWVTRQTLTTRPLLSIRNNGVEKFSIGPTGTVNLASVSTADLDVVASYARITLQELTWSSDLWELVSGFDSVYDLDGDYVDLVLPPGRGFSVCQDNGITGYDDNLRVDPDGKVFVRTLKFSDLTEQTTAATGGSYDIVSDPFNLAVS